MPSKSFPLFLMAQGLLWSTVTMATEAPEEATLYRDTWGVPHVYAQTEAGGAYALGYAQAEDRLADIHDSVRTGLGRMSEAYGKQHVEQDYIMRLCRNEPLAREYWETAPAHLKEIVTAFAAGIQACAEQYPEKVPDHALALEPWMFLTVGRAMILRWPLGTLQDDLKAGQKKEQKKVARRQGPAMRSNQWAVAPSRSADNIPILLADPHLSWEGLAVLYEARVHAGNLHMNGFFLIGSPLVGIGHNRHVGWAMTTGGPDTSDVYDMKFRLGLPPQYQYDGQWRNVRVESITIRVKGSSPVVKPALYTHLGPVISEPNLETGQAYVGASPYLEQMGLLEQSYRMAMATTNQELFDALGMHRLNEQNLMFADVEGSIGYVRSGATPIRPDGYDWSAPVPGDTSKTAWKGVHPIEDLVHLFDPSRGYMVNCNISPEVMLIDSPLTPDRWPPYIYNVSWDTNNPRGRRTVQLLEADQSVTREEAMAYALDVYDLHAKSWQQALRSAVEGAAVKRAAVAEAATNPLPAESSAQSSGVAKVEFEAAIAAILAWDGQYVPEATATTLMKFWRIKCGQQLDLAPMAAGNLAPLAAGNSLDAETQQQMLALLAETMGEMKQTYGRWDIAWGEVHHVGRGGQTYPVGGADFQAGNREVNFSETLFDVRTKTDPSHPGRQLAYSGSMATLLMFFHPDHVESYSCTPWGQSADPTSPHYTDQGRELYSTRHLKPTWWAKNELLQHVESTTVLKFQKN